ncbi:unnamed protein product, partial [Ectocarpus sp. 12 AP-2014]
MPRTKKSSMPSGSHGWWSDILLPPWVVCFRPGFVCDRSSLSDRSSRPTRARALAVKFFRGVGSAAYSMACDPLAHLLALCLCSGRFYSPSGSYLGRAETNPPRRCCFFVCSFQKPLVVCRFHPSWVSLNLPCPLVRGKPWSNHTHTISRPVVETGKDWKKLVGLKIDHQPANDASSEILAQRPVPLAL